MDPKVRFEQEKYLAVEGFLEDPLLCVAYRYAQLKGALEHGAGDSQVPETPAFYGDLLMDTLLEVSTATIEELTGLELHPTNSYFRLYKHGDELKRHTDREACEITMSLCLGIEVGEAGDDYHWPMFLRPDAEGEGISVDCRPGDCIIFCGNEVEHWRENFEGRQQAQVFLHYVDRNGKYSDHKWDKRSSLGVRRS